MRLWTTLAWIWLLRKLGPWFGVLPCYSLLRIRVFRADGSVEDLGIVSARQVTTAFAGHLVDALKGADQNPALGQYKYHKCGTGSTAEGPTNSHATFTSPFPAEPLASGTQGEASQKVYRSVMSVDFTDSRTITEHGIFNSPTPSSAGNLLDRSVFAGIAVINGETIEFTYDLTVNDGG